MFILLHNYIIPILQNCIFFIMKYLYLLQITKEDALPKNICQRCVYKLDMFYEFRVSCMTTDTVLKNYADSLKHLAASVSQVSLNISNLKQKRKKKLKNLPIVTNSLTNNLIITILEYNILYLV